MSSEYEKVALEYYDSCLHPTCTNLRQASYFGLVKLKNRLRRSGKRFCEVGCGKSMLNKLTDFVNVELISVDMNASMLTHSNGNLVQGDANLLPFADNTFNGIFGSLIDPFNTSKFYQEAHRVLKNNGCLLFSVPDYKWSSEYKRKHELISDEFNVNLSLANGTNVSLPSFVYPPKFQMDNLRKKAGFNQVECYPISIKESLNKKSVSKLFYNRDGQFISENIVTMYLALK